MPQVAEQDIEGNIKIKCQCNSETDCIHILSNNCNTITADVVLMKTDTDQPIMDIIGFIYDKNILTTECKNEDSEWK